MKFTPFQINHKIISRGAVLMAAVAIFLPSVSSAAVLAQYTFTGTNNDATSDSEANSTATGLGIGTLGTEFSGGSGFSTTAVTPAPTPPATASAPTRFVRASVTTTTQATAIAANDYFKFTLTPTVGFEADLTNFFFDYSANGANGNANTANFFVRSSVDNFAANIGTTASVAANGTGTVASYQRQTIDLSGAAFQNLTAATEFRVYIFQSLTTTDGIARLDNLTLNGTIATIPEPSSVAMLGLGAAALLGVRRRDRSVSH